MRNKRDQAGSGDFIREGLISTGKEHLDFKIEQI